MADIEEFEANYRGSDSEKKDLINLYKECKGNMRRYLSSSCAFHSILTDEFNVLTALDYRLFCSMLCSDAKLDSHRFKDIIDEAIASGNIFELSVVGFINFDC